MQLAQKGKLKNCFFFPPFAGFFALKTIAITQNASYLLWSYSLLLELKKKMEQKTLARTS